MRSTVEVEDTRDQLSVAVDRISRQIPGRTLGPGELDIPTVDQTGAERHGPGRSHIADLHSNGGRRATLEPQAVDGGDPILVGTVRYGLGIRRHAYRWLLDRLDLVDADAVAVLGVDRQPQPIGPISRGEEERLGLVVLAHEGREPVASTPDLNAVARRVEVPVDVQAGQLAALREGDFKPVRPGVRAQRPTRPGVAIDGIRRRRLLDAGRGYEPIDRSVRLSRGSVAIRPVADDLRLRSGVPDKVDIEPRHLSRQTRRRRRRGTPHDRHRRVLAPIAASVDGAHHDLITAACQRYGQREVALRPRLDRGQQLGAAVGDLTADGGAPGSPADKGDGCISSRCPRPVEVR